MTALSAGGRVKGRGLGSHLAHGDASAIDAIAAEMKADATPIGPGPSRGLASRTIEEQIRELEAGANTKRTKRPLYHVHCDPRWDDEELVALFWRLFEEEFGLTRARFASQRHGKGNRGAHTHRVYDLTRSDGSVVNMRNDFYRREKLMVIACWILGRAMPPIPHRQAVRKALVAEARADVAAWMDAHPQAPRAVAQQTPRERQIEQRTGAHHGRAVDAIMTAWTAADSGRSFVAALQANGLALAQGDEGPVVVDAAKGLWLLTRVIGRTTHAQGARVKAAAVRDRVRDVPLVSIADARRALVARAATEERARVAQAEAARQAAQTRAMAARVSADLRRRAAAARATLNAILSEAPPEPPALAKARGSLADAQRALTEAERRLATASGRHARVNALAAARQGWWARAILWATGTTARLDAMTARVRARAAEADALASRCRQAVGPAEVTVEVHHRAWRTQVAQSKADRSAAPREDLSFAVVALEMIEHDPAVARLPEPELRMAVQRYAGPAGRTPRP